MNKSLLFTFVFILSLCVGVYTVNAVTLCPSSCDYSSLSAALATTNGTNATIYINESGTYSIGSQKDYSINDSSSSSVSSSNGVIRIMADDVNLDCSASTFTGNNTDKGLYHGAGIVASGVNNITIQNCTLQNYTYGLYLTSSNGSTIRNITSTLNRYGMLDFTQSTVTVDSVSSTQNRYGIDVYGFGSNFDSSTHVTLTNSKIWDSVYDGLSVDSAWLTVTNSTFKRNGIGNSDSAIWTYQALLNVTNSSFSSNYATGIYLSFSTSATVENATMWNQTYGVITEENSSLFMSSSDLQNTSYAIYDYHNSSITLEESTLSSLSGSTQLTLNFDETPGNTSVARLINMSYNSSNTFFGSNYIGENETEIRQIWYIKFSYNASPIPVLNLSISDVNGTEIYSNYTNSSGDTPQIPLVTTFQNLNGLYNLTNYTIEAYALGYVKNTYSFYFDTNRWINLTLVNQTGAIPTYSTLTGNTTDFTAVTNLETVPDAVVETTAGNILFLGTNNFSGADLDDGITISFGLVGLNSTDLPTLNVSARIAMYNVSCPVSTIYYSAGYLASKEDVLANGSDCEQAGVCSNIECSNSILKFNVSGFSSYAVGTDANLTIWDDTDDMNYSFASTVNFFANYTNNSNVLNQTGTFCQIEFNISGGMTAPVNMTYSELYSAYQYNRSFSSAWNSTYTVICNGLANGFNTLNATDNFTVYADTMAPSISLYTWIFNNSVVGDSVWIIFNASDSLDSLLNVSLSVLDGSGNAVFNTSNSTNVGTLYNISFSVPSLAEGNYTLNGTAIDDSGNIGKEFTVDLLSVTIADVSSPVISIVYPVNASLFALGTTNTSLNITTSEIASCKWSNSSGFNFTTEGSSMSTSDNLAHSSTYSGMSNGNNYTVYYKCNDSANNINVLSVVHTFGVTPDTTSPNISYSLPTPDDASTITTSTVNIRVNLTEVSNGTLTFGSTTYTLKNSTGGNTGTLLNKTLYNISDGTYSYYVKVWDSGLNLATAATRTLTIDTSPPTITFSSPVNYSTVYNQLNVALSITTSESSTCTLSSGKVGGTSVSSQSLTPQSSANTSFVKYFNTTSDSSGYDNYFTVQCTDSESHSTSKSSYFKLNDTTAPSVSFVSPSPSNNGGINSADVTINITSNEVLGSVKTTRVDGGSWVTLTTASGYYYHTFSNLNDSEHTVDVNVSDTKGNLVMQSISFDVDTQAPEIEIISPDDKSTVRDCVDVVLNVTSSEESDCSFIWYIDEEKECVDDCGADYDKCYERADDSSERTECSTRQDDCELDCEDEQYNNYEKDDLKEESRSVCNTCIDECENTCDDDYDECMDKADNSDDKADCKDDYNDCVQADCPYDCEDQCIWSYSLAWDKCVADASYRLTFTCEDKGGNTNSTNSTFEMKDNTPPTILDLTNDKIVSGDSATLSVTTSEPGTCKYSSTQTSFAAMENELVGNEESHTKVISFDSPGSYTYNFACNDSNNNIMSSYNSTTLEVTLTSNPYSYSRSDKLEAGEHEISFDDDISISSLKIKLKKEVENETFQVEELPEKPTGISSPKGSVYKYVSLKNNRMTPDVLESAEIKFKVPKSWISSNGLSASQIVLSHYDGSWVDLDTKKDSEDALNIIFTAETKTFSYFAISAKQVSTSAVVEPVDSNATTVPEVEEPANTDVQTPEERQTALQWPDDGKKSWTWLWILLGVLGVFGAGGAVYVTLQGPSTRSKSSGRKSRKSKSHSKSHVKPDANKDVSLSETEQIIHSSLSEGLSFDQIKESFMGNGWSSDDFDKVYSAYFEKINPVEEAEPALEPETGSESDLGAQDGESQADQADISTFIRQSLAAGVSRDEIVSQLVGSGWPQVEADEYVSKEMSADSAGYSAVESTTPPEEAEPAPDLGKYIRDEIKRGRTNHELADELIKAGWPKEMILNELHSLESEAVQSHSDASQTQIEDFIRTQLEQGMSEDEIKETLRDSGWSNDDITRALK